MPTKPEEVSAVRKRLNDAKERVKDLEQKVEYNIQENPWKSVGIAFGAGFIGGILVCALVRKK